MLESKLYVHLSTVAAVTSICNKRIYPLVLPQNPTYPAVTYSRVGGIRENSLSGYSTIEKAIVQVDAWATSFEDAANLSSAVITAVTAASAFSAIAMTSPLDLYEDSIDIFRRTIDISIWNRE